MSKSRDSPISPLRRAALTLEHGLSKASSHIRKAFDDGSRVMVPDIYRATSVGDRISVKGRVMAARALPEPAEHDTWAVNASRMVRRWMTAESANAEVSVRISGKVHSTASDEEGYFEMEIADPGNADELEFFLPQSTNHEPIRIPVLRNASTPPLVVISDVDDTIFLSNTAKLVGMVRTALTGNALTREIFPGIANFYRELRNGKSGHDRNPVNYVTSSPWNLHSLIEMIFRKRDIPAGTFFMTDWGLSEDHWLKESNPIHKREAILEIMGWYPDSPLVLLGDSSQHDTEIYKSIAVEFPGRVVAIAIRNVTGLTEPRQKIPDEIPFLLHDDTETCREFVLGKLGWL